MRSLGDVKWTLPPLVSYLYALGGWGWRMLVRGIGIPFVVCFYSFMYYRLFENWYPWVYAALFGGLFGSFTLPLTLFGDGLGDHWFNWIWVWIAGALKGAALFPMIFLIQKDVQDKKKEKKKKLFRWLIGVGLCAASFGITLTLSSLVGWPVHKWTEIINGLVLGGVAAWLI